MAITAADINFKGSTGATASAGNSVANGGAGTNLGDVCTSGTLTDNTLNNLFDNITGAENAASQVDYQCIFVHNGHASLTLENAVVYLSAETAGGASIAISVDTTAATAVGAASPQAKDIASSTTAPATQTFSSPTTEGTGLAIGNLTAGQVRAIWVRRTAANTAALDNDSVTLTVAGDTAA
jgi:hypothetical protein